MSKKKNRHRSRRAKAQGRQHDIPQGGVSLDKISEAKKRELAEKKQRIESLSAAIYSEISKELCCNEIEAAQQSNGEVDVDKATEAFENAVVLATEAALVFARNVWGIDAKRQRPPEERPPVKPLDDDEDLGD